MHDDLMPEGVVVTDWTDKAFSTVTEITKQVITLATGIIALTITFFKDFATHATAGAKDVLAWGWGCYVLAIVFGMFTLMCVAGVQQAIDKPRVPKKPPATPPVPDRNAGTINVGNLRFMGALQLFFFGAGIILTVVAGIMAT